MMPIVDIISIQLVIHCFPILCRSASELSQKGLDPSTNVSVSNNPATAIEAPAEGPPASVQSGSTPAPPEPQNSTIRSEVMPSSPVVIHHVQSSPVHMQQSQQSAALTAQPSPPLTPSPTHTTSPHLSKTQGRESPKGATSDPPSPARLKKTQGNPVNNGNGTAHQDLVIEELQNSKDKSKSRAMSIEVCQLFSCNFPRQAKLWLYSVFFTASFRCPII